MNLPAHRTAAIVLALLAAACATPREDGSRVPMSGEAAPALAVTVVGGGAFSLADATKERNVVVVFYRGRF